jgi:ATP-dependent Clp protease ATP-binding subunit ClpA
MEHLLLGLLREENSLAASILTTHGLRINDVRIQIVKLLRETATPSVSSIRAQVSEQIDRIKGLVEQLGRTPPDSSEARDLVERIGDDLDDLKRYLAE